MSLARTRHYDVLCVDVDYSKYGSPRSLAERMSGDFACWPFEVYLHQRPPSITFQPIHLSHELRKLRRFFSKWRLQNYARIVEGARHMIEVEKPAVIVMTYENGIYGQAVIAAATEFGVPTLAIQHGFISPSSIEYIPCHKQLLPTVTAVGGEYTANLLMKNGYPNDRLAITGYTRHDDLYEFRKANPDRTTVLKHYGLSADRQIILFAAGGFTIKNGYKQDYDDAIVTNLSQLAADDARFQLVVRPHPRYGRIASKKSNAMVIRGEHHDLMWASNFFVTINSTLALDALVFGKTVFMLDEEDVQKLDLGDAVIPFKISTLQTMLKQAADGRLELPSEESRRREVNSHATQIDGEASLRIMRLIEQFHRGNPDHHNSFNLDSMAMRQDGSG